MEEEPFMDEIIGLRIVIFCGESDAEGNAAPLVGIVLSYDANTASHNIEFESGVTLEIDLSLEKFTLEEIEETESNEDATDEDDDIQHIEQEKEKESKSISGARSQQQVTNNRNVSEIRTTNSTVVDERKNV